MWEKKAYTGSVQLASMHLHHEVSTARKMGLLYTPRISIAAERRETWVIPSRAGHVLGARGSFILLRLFPASTLTSVCKLAQVVTCFFAPFSSSHPRTQQWRQRAWRDPKKRGRKTLLKERRTTRVYSSIDYRCEDRKMVGKLRGVAVSKK
jgi:hypothetical protein